MKLRYGMYLIGVMFFSGRSHAVICTISNVSVVNFGTISQPLAMASSTTSMTFNYTCAKELLETVGNANICFNIGNASSSVSSRAMIRTGSPTNSLSYQLYQDSARTVVWGNQYQSGTMFPKIRLSLLDLVLPVSGQLTVYGTLNNTSQVNAIPGVYQDNTIIATITTNVVGTLNPSTTCGTNTTTSFPIPVTAVISKQCNISYANPVNIGSVESNQSNIAGSSSLGVTCTRNTPYAIGLLPSNSNTVGNGVMKGNRSGNSDTISYQLRSTAGSAGTQWGNTTQNTVASTGSGALISHNVYVTVPSANYIPDSYSDTVTIFVTY